MPGGTKVTASAGAVIAVCGILALAGCRSPSALKPTGLPAGRVEGGPVAPPQAPEAAKPKAEKLEPSVPAGWELRFTETFNRADLGKDWESLEGSWSIEKGMLSGQGTIMCTRKFPGAQRLEFDAISDNPCDLTGILCANEAGYEGGYFFGFGSENNAYSKLLIQGAEVKQYDALITSGKLHHVVCERDGATLKHIIDGKLVLTYKDEAPLVGKSHEMIGFYIYTGGKVGNVKVFTKPEK